MKVVLASADVFDVSGKAQRTVYGQAVFISASVHRITDYLRELGKLGQMYDYSSKAATFIVDNTNVVEHYIIITGRRGREKPIAATLVRRIGNALELNDLDSK